MNSNPNFSSKYQEKIAGLNAEELSAPGVHYIQFWHDPDCSIYAGHTCSCDPDVKVTDEVGFKEGMKSQRQAEIRARVARKYTDTLMERLRAGRGSP